MLKITRHVTFDRKAAVARLKAASDEALTLMGEQALKDVTQYVPKDQSVLQRSGITNSDIKAKDGVYVLRWDTPYAQYLWHGDVMHGDPTSRTYGPDKIKFTSALAREEWAKYAQKVHGADWRRVYQAAMKAVLKE